VEQVAKSRATVLLEGESGTGKEVFAQALHYYSSRRDRSFVRINCAALPEGVLESELFGHEKGAFTGAVRQRPGRFELAHQGTLFLDEIGAADARVQLRLLRVLQEQEFERVGGTETLKVDVRVIAATNANLWAEVREGKFRADLFYRLNVVPIKLPPLRERSEDLPLLIEHFVRRAARQNRRPVEGVEARAMEHLQGYPWPGNVRQLENTIERMVVLAKGPYLTEEDVPQDVRQWRDEADVVDLGILNFQEARLLFERRFLKAALRRHNGVIAQVADAIGMSRKNLYMKLENLDIDYEQYRVGT
jgi:DNA-binding NtrC family response regulator